MSDRSLDKLLQNLSAYTALGTGFCFLAGYAYDTGFYREIGSNSIELLSFADFLDSFKNAFLEGIFLALGSVIVANGYFDFISITKMGSFLRGAFASDGPMASESHLSDWLPLQLWGAISFLFLILCSASILVWGIPTTGAWANVMPWLFVIAVVVFLVAGLVTHFEKVRSLWRRRIEMITLLSFVIFGALNGYGSHCARNLVQVEKPTAVITLDNGKVLESAIISIISGGYLLKDITSKRTLFIQREKVVQIQFLK